MLKSLRFLRIEFPQAEGATFAWQKAPNQHDLCHYNQIDLPLLEVSDTALQQRYVLGRPLVKPFVDP